MSYMDYLSCTGAEYKSKHLNIENMGIDDAIQILEYYSAGKKTKERAQGFPAAIAIITKYAKHCWYDVNNTEDPKWIVGYAYSAVDNARGKLQDIYDKLNALCSLISRHERFIEHIDGAYGCIRVALEQLEQALEELEPNGCIAEVAFQEMEEAEEDED